MDCTCIIETAQELAPQIIKLDASTFIVFLTIASSICFVIGGISGYRTRKSEERDQKSLAKSIANHIEKIN